MSWVSESFDQLSSAGYAYPVGYGAAAVSLAATSGVSEVVSGLNEITAATAGYSGGFILLAVATGVAAVIKQRHGES